MQRLALAAAFGIGLGSLPLAVHAQHTHFNPLYCKATVQFKVKSLSGPDRGMSRSTQKIRLREAELKDFGVTTLEFPANNKVVVRAIFRVANTSAADRDANQCPGDGAVSWFIDNRDRDRRFDGASEFTASTSVKATLRPPLRGALVRPGTVLFRESATWRTGFNVVGRTLKIVEPGKPGVITSPRGSSDKK